MKEIDVTLSSGKWGKNTDSLPVGQYNVLSTTFTVKFRKPMKGSEKERKRDMAYLQFDIDFENRSTTVYKREKRLDSELDMKDLKYPFRTFQSGDLILKVVSRKDDPTKTAQYLTWIQVDGNEKA